MFTSSNVGPGAAGGECSRHWEAIILRVRDIFNIRSDKLGHRTVIRSDLTTSHVSRQPKGCCLLTKDLEHDRGTNTIILNWIKHGKDWPKIARRFFK